MTQTTGTLLLAGRDLDERVACDVLGYYRHCDEPTCFLYTVTGRDTIFEIPGFSADIGLAWTIVELWQSKGYHWSVATNWYGQIAVNVWRIEGESHYEHRLAFVTADTAPLAICAAGLMVAEAEKVVAAQ